MIVAFNQSGFNDAMVAINGVQIVALIAIGIYLSKMTERLARLEEWVRLHNGPRRSR